MTNLKKTGIFVAVIIVAAAALTCGIILATAAQEPDTVALELDSPGSQMPGLNGPPGGIDQANDPEGLQR